MSTEMLNTPLLIENRCNENRRRTSTEPVPYSPEEIVEAAIDAEERGATIFHFHARDSRSGDPLHSTEAYRETMRLLKAHTDLIVHPTTGYTDATDLDSRVGPIVEMSVDPAVSADMAALAFGVTNLDRWDDSSARFEPGDLVYRNTRRALEHTIGAFTEIDLPMISVCWELSHVRTAMAYRNAGAYRQHRLWQFALTGGTLFASGSPTVETLIAMRAEIPAGEPWMVWCQGGDVLPLAAHAIAMGGHVGIGLGDHDYPRLGAPSNGELVAEVVELARIVGRPIATSAQARELLSIS